MTIAPAQLRESAARQRAAAPSGATVPLADELEAAAAEIERIANQRWIPVDERLPADNVSVLVNHEPGGVEMAFRQDGQWGISWTNSLISGSGYTHWMPLPAPPTADKSSAVAGK